MSFTPSYSSQEQLSKSLVSRETQLRPREVWIEVITAVLLIAATFGLVLLDPPHDFNWAAIAVSAVVLIFADRVKFETPFGFTSATQLGFIPMIFAVPVALFPAATAICLMLSCSPELVEGRLQPSRLLRRAGNAANSIGPAAVFAIAACRPSSASGLLLVVALLAQFIVDLLYSTLRSWLNGYEALRWPQDDLWVYAVDAALAAVGLLAASGLKDSALAPAALLPLLWLLSTFAHERSTRLESLLELNETYRGTARVLGDMIEADDSYTGIHSRSVVELCMEVAAYLQLDIDQRRNLEFGALLHDIGKTAIPKEILNKPGTLTLEEWAVMRTHTIEGQRLLDTVGGFMHEVGLIVRAHHERWDGTGYPDRLKRTEIPVEARIIAACDAWNAMRTDRVYRPSMSHNFAIAELRAAAGSQLDPDVVDALLATVCDQWMPLVKLARA